MESIWEQISRIDERQVELAQSVLALSRERVELERMHNVGDNGSFQCLHEELVQRERVLTETVEEQRRMIRRLIDEFETATTESGTDYTELTDTDTDTDTDESCPDDEKIKMICTCDCNVKEENLLVHWLKPTRCIRRKKLHFHI